jgi:hypothetical protein
VVFVGFSSDGKGGTVTGLYTTLTGALSKIVATGDAINGKTISTINFGPGGFSENQIVFEADFTDGSQANAATTIKLQSLSADAGLLEKPRLAVAGENTRARKPELFAGRPVEPARDLQHV